MTAQCAVFLLLCILLFPPSALAGDRPLRIVVPLEPEVAARYDAFLKEKGVPVGAVTDLKSPVAERGVAEVVIALQALALGGLPCEMEVFSVPNSDRARQTVRDGVAVMSVTTFFSQAIPPDVHRSSEVVPVGGFVKGVYGRDGNALLRAVDSLESLREFEAVIPRAWKVDWKTLSGMGLKKVRSVPTFPMIPALIDTGKVDFTLLEFPATADLVIKWDDIRLYPVPGIKVGLADSRHYIVSEHHPDRRRVLAALETGLAAMRRQGTIMRYFTECGFYNEQVADWKLIYP